MSVLESVPTLDVLVTLETERDENLPRKPHENDLADLAALSVAIPYCDIVVTEKHWANVAKRNKLNRKYDTCILTDVRELETVLKSGGGVWRYPQKVCKQSVGVPSL